MTYAVVAVTAGLSQPSSSRLLAERLATATATLLPGATTTVIELRELAHAIADATVTGFTAGPLADAVETLRTADAVIMVSPVFNASYSGLFKSFLDVLEPGTLTATPMIIGATGGTARHSLALEFAYRPVFAYLRAQVAPTAVFAATEDFGTHGSALASGSAPPPTSSPDWCSASPPGCPPTRSPTRCRSTACSPAERVRRSPLGGHV